MTRYAAEFIGTFVLVFFGTGAIIVDDQVAGSTGVLGIAIAFGLSVMIMIHGFGHVSGAHINPAVSIAFAFTDRFKTKHVLGYVTAQCLGAVMASLSLAWLFDFPDEMGVTSSIWPTSKTFFLEMFLTYVLMLVILCVSQNADLRRFTAIAVGGVVGLEALVAGPITGASMNPARSFGPALVSGDWTGLWVYLLAPVFGALMASATWRRFR